MTDVRARVLVAGSGPGIDKVSELVKAVSVDHLSGTIDEVVADLESMPAAADDPRVLVLAEASGNAVDLVATASRLASILPPGAALGVFTETTAASELAGSGANASRVVALRMVAAAPTPKLVEVVPSLVTVQEALSLVHEVLTEIGLVTVQSPDLPGFLIDSLARRYLNHAAQLLEDQVAVGHDLDRAVRLGLGHPQGPMAVLDQLGIENHIAISDRLYAATGDTRFIPPTILRRLAQVGWAESTEAGAYPPRRPYA